MFMAPLTFSYLLELLKQLYISNSLFLWGSQLPGGCSGYFVSNPTTWVKLDCNIFWILRWSSMHTNYRFLLSGVHGYNRRLLGWISFGVKLQNSYKDEKTSPGPFINKVVSSECKKFQFCVNYPFKRQADDAWRLTTNSSATQDVVVDTRRQERDRLADTGNALRFEAQWLWRTFLWGGLDGFCTYADKIKKEKDRYLWGMLFWSYYRSEPQSLCWGETPICEERWEWNCPFEDVRKNSPCVQGCCQQEPRTVKPLRKKCVLLALTMKGTRQWKWRMVWRVTGGGRLSADGPPPLYPPPFDLGVERRRVANTQWVQFFQNKNEQILQPEMKKAKKREGGE